MGTLLGYQLQTLREKKGLKQEEVADLLGIQRDIYCGYENGDYFPKNNGIYKKIAKFFDVTERYLFKIKDEEEMPQIDEFPNREAMRQRAVKLIDNIREFYNDPDISWEDKSNLRYKIWSIYLDYWYKRKEANKIPNKKILETEINDHSEADFYD